MKPDPRTTKFEITELSSEGLAEAGTLLGLAYRDNPLTFRLYGDDPDVRASVNEVLFPIRMKAADRPPLAVWDGARLLGVCGFDAPDRPEMSTDDMRAIMTKLASVGPDLPSTLMGMLTEWRKRAPEEPHWNLGPVGVTPEMQGRGIASAMLGRFCDLVDAAAGLAFLETDSETNSHLYEKFGFMTTDCSEILGVRMWFMVREARR